MIDKIIANNYKVIKELGKGGFGTVYLALDLRLERSVAIKVLDRVEEEAQESFEQEAKVIAGLNHSNIGVLYHVTDIADNQICIIMAFYEGQDLKIKLAEGALDVSQALDYATQIAKGLHHAHKHNILHRDIKPANVFITAEDDEVKILDFGLAQVLVENIGQTEENFSGSIPYAAPERFRKHKPNFQTDVWSWGVVLFEMLTGKLPFDGATEFNTIVAAILSKPLNLDTLDKYTQLATNHEAIQEILDKALAEELTERYESFAEVLDDLSRLSGKTTGKELITITEEIYNRQPYKGLAAFKEQDSEYFCGRDVTSTELVEKLHTQNFLALVGPSGSGKSSLVFAGIVPKLKEENNWLICSFRPRNNPFTSLANVLTPLFYADPLEEASKREEFSRGLQEGNFSLTTIVGMIAERHDNQRLLLIIDQFEELYTLNSNLEQNTFIEQVLEATQNSNLNVLITMRADFISHTTRNPRLTETLNKGGMVLLGAMSRGDLQAVIEEPAKKCGVIFSTGLVEDILDDVLSGGSEEVAAGRLPLLEFALTELWERKENPITHSTYRAIGKVEGALAQHAEQVYQTFTKKEQEELEHVFVQLVKPGEGTEDTRQVVTKKQIGKNWELVTRLADERLVTTGTKSGNREPLLVPRPLRTARTYF